MVDRLAKAMWRETNPDEHWEASDAGGYDWHYNRDTFIRMARAVLKELYEPTEEMLRAAMGHIVGDYEQERQMREDKNTWQVMIKVALKE